MPTHHIIRVSPCTNTVSNIGWIIHDKNPSMDPSMAINMNEAAKTLRCDCK